ncbi:DUF6438 domain-containing protein [Marivirga sp.]|uniref:DUF6438 domain-containing protein n=1 Tax=Marivirga sp. TaxID=2018662 RepID=UPI002D7EBA52|nr:DUF6438 domain-containing protein [Marivirga sp.]HET8859830.1 DUF6438 domain-containing protein [Marivirga sp.]
MRLFYLNSISFLLCCCIAMSCKTNQTNSVPEAEVIFSLKTTSCMGECPVFEMELYGDKTLVFNGKQHTEVSGEQQKTLTDEQFEALLGIIESADWPGLDDEYKSTMLDLPTQNFKYNRNGIQKSVIKYGTAPKSINNMSDIILTFVEEQVFNE